MKTLLVMLNLAAAILTIPVTSAIHTMYVMDASRAYTTLDRAGVIDHAKLEHQFPQLIPNDRHEFGQWACSSRQDTLIGFPFTIAFSLNALLIALFWKRNKKQMQNKASQVTSQ